MPRENFFLARPSLTDAGTLSSTGTVSSTLPITNLQTKQPGEVCRFTSLTGMEVSMDLGSANNINLVAFINHNGTTSATWQIRTSTTSLAACVSSPDYDSGSVSMWATGTKPAGYDNLSSLHWIGSPAGTVQNARYIRIDIADAGNPDGFFDIGRLYIEKGWQPGNDDSSKGIPVNDGWGIGFDDPSFRERMSGGQIQTKTITPIRVFEGYLGLMDEDGAFTSLYEIMRTRGTSQDVLLCFDPGATTHLHRYLIYGLLTRLEPIRNPFYNLHGTRITIEEMVA